MGQLAGSTKFDKSKCKSLLRQAVGRMNIHRQKKLNKIAKSKDDICKHLSSNNEVNAKIWCETLINDENQIPCYDIACTMSDQLQGRLDQIAKFGPSKDMTVTYATLIHIAPKFEVEELTKVRSMLQSLMGKEFVVQADEDKEIINPIVAKNIDYKIPSDGEVVYRMRQLAKERNIQYQPSHDMQAALNQYLDINGLTDPFDEGKPKQVYMPPQYNPGGPPAQPPGQPPSQPPGWNYPPGGGPGGNVPMYPMHPMQPMQPMQPQMPYQPPMDYNNAYPHAPPAYVPDNTGASQAGPQPGQPAQPDGQYQPSFEYKPSNPKSGEADLGPSIPTGDVVTNNPTTNKDPDIDDFEARMKALGNL